MIFIQVVGSSFFPPQLPWDDKKLDFMDLHYTWECLFEFFNGTEFSISSSVSDIAFNGASKSTNFTGLRASYLFR